MAVMHEPMVICRASIYVFRATIARPVRTSFGVMHTRPAVLLRLEDSHGYVGWGEAWCNFPSCGAEHRARLLESVLVPALLHQPFTTAVQAHDCLAQKIAILALQADEPGPLAQCLAAVDIALWDIYARRQCLPLHRALGGTGSGCVPAYASGINPDVVLESIEQCRAEGFRAFKCKVGFDDTADRDNIRQGLNALHDKEILAIDANQAWTLPEALHMAEYLQDVPLAWLEEPLRCDTHISQWELLARHCSVPLAAGENLRSRAAFRECIDSAAIAIVQPDLCKWGGLTHCLWVAQEALHAGRRYYPHYLGGGIGLMASAHLLAAVGGDGLLEIDVNANPLREGLAQSFPALRDGMLYLNDEPGLGVSPDLDGMRQHLVGEWHSE